MQRESAVKRTRDIYAIMDSWDRQIENYNELEDVVENAIKKLIAHRPGRHSKRFDDEGLKLAIETYILELENGGALRESIRELRSIQTRFPGQIMDCENVAPLILSAAKSYSNNVDRFLKLYCKA